MNDTVYFYQSTPEVSYINTFDNLPENINIFSNLKDIHNEINSNTLKSYNKLLETIKTSLSIIDQNIPIKNNLSKMINFVDEDNEVELEWIIRNNYRIGFIVDVKGNISYFRTIKNGSSTDTFSDDISSEELNDKINNLLNEVLSLT